MFTKSVIIIIVLYIVRRVDNYDVIIISDMTIMYIYVCVCV